MESKGKLTAEEKCILGLRQQIMFSLLTYGRPMLVAAGEGKSNWTDSRWYSFEDIAKAVNGEFPSVSSRYGGCIVDDIEHRIGEAYELGKHDGRKNEGGMRMGSEKKIDYVTPEFDPTAIYMAGDVVCYEGKVVRIAPHNNPRWLQPGPKLDPKDYRELRKAVSDEDNKDWEKYFETLKIDPELFAVDYCEDHVKEAFLEGKSIGYVRGKAEAEKRIWEAAKRKRSSAEFSHTGPGVLIGAISIEELEKIIFGEEAHVG